MAVRYMLLLVLAVLLLPAGASADFMIFSDRGAWEAAASSAGLDVETQDFASDPGIGFELGGADFAVLSGIYNTSSQDLSPTFDLLSIDFTAGDTLFGIGMDFSAGFGIVSGFPVVMVSDGVQAASSGTALGAYSDTFLGVLSTEPLVPECPGCTDPSEVRIQVQVGGALMFADNLSVAFVPEPGTAGLLAFGLGGLALKRREARV